MRAWINYGNIYGWWIFPVPLWLNVPWSNKGALGTNNKFLYCLHLPSILHKVVWSAVKHLSTFKNKKTTTKTNISTSKQGLEIELLKFKSFQDANETCRVQAVLDDRVSGHNILNRWILFSQKVRQRYLVVIIIDCIGTCLSGSLYSMAERQGQEKLHHFWLKKAFKR